MPQEEVLFVFGEEVGEDRQGWMRRRRRGGGRAGCTRREPGPPRRRRCPAARAEAWSRGEGAPDDLSRLSPRGRRQKGSSVNTGGTGDGSAQIDAYSLQSG